MLFTSIEYQQLDKQLDQIDSILNVLEEKNDHLQEQAMKFLVEARKMREEQEKELKEEEEKGKEEKGETSKHTPKEKDPKT